jgi:peptidoglycan-associated lipoprotein
MERNEWMSRDHRRNSMRLSITVGLLAGLAGCAHSGSAMVTSETPAPAPAAQPAPAPAPQPAVAEVQPIPVRTESIYFDFDKSELKPAGQEFLAGFGDLLAKHPDLHVRIEGNCDERGTAQYNIALGYRRADTAKKYLVQMGAKDGQIKTVSYGKERPRAKGHDEEAWAQNRRDDFIPDRDTLPAKPVAENP